VWMTTNGGRKWTISFTGVFLRPSGFQDTIGCSGSTVWVLFVGPGAAMNQKPYVLYRSTDGGLHWAARMEEGYFGSVYPHAHARKDLGGYPGPFTVVNPTSAYFLGFTYPIGMHGQVMLSGTTTDGRSWYQHPVPCIWALRPVTFAFTAPGYGWVAGTCNGREAAEMTTNGGHTWTRHFLP
jgi:hypothetical protein